MKNYGLSLFIIFLLCYASFAFCSDLICEGHIIIESNTVEEHDKFTFYKGNVIVSKGLLKIKSPNLYKKNTHNNVEPLNMEEITFSIHGGGEGTREIHGSADKIIFHTLPCILDIFGEIEIKTDTLILKYNSPIRYILNSNEISPLLYHIDQRPKIH